MRWTIAFLAVGVLLVGTPGVVCAAGVQDDAPRYAERESASCCLADFAGGAHAVVAAVVFILIVAAIFAALTWHYADVHHHDYPDKRPKERPTPQP